MSLAELVITSVTVSYTHLDVYKRQALDRPVGRLARALAWLRYDQANSAPWRARLYSDALHFLAGIPSVKDPVYLVVAEAGGLVNCLLYTSRCV